MEADTNRTWLTKEEAETFVGKNDFFYLGKWRKYSESTFKGWNWAAFFFGISWMAYRRMYTEALLYYLFIAFAGVLIVVTFGAIGIRVNGDLLRSILQLFVVIFGNAIYRKKALRVLRKTIHLSETDRLSVLEAKGGTSVAGVICCILLQIAFAFLLVFIALLI